MPRTVNERIQRGGKQAKKHVTTGLDIRGVFLQKLETILPETRNMTNADCLALLMGDDPPQKD